MAWPAAMSTVGLRKSCLRGQMSEVQARLGWNFLVASRCEASRCEGLGRCVAGHRTGCFLEGSVNPRENFGNGSLVTCQSQGLIIFPPRECHI